MTRKSYVLPVTFRTFANSPQEARIHLERMLRTGDPNTVLLDQNVQDEGLFEHRPGIFLACAPPPDRPGGWDLMKFNLRRGGVCFIAIPTGKSITGRIEVNQRESGVVDWLTFTGLENLPAETICFAPRRQAWLPISVVVEDEWHATRNQLQTPYQIVELEANHRFVLTFGGLKPTTNQTVPQRVTQLVQDWMKAEKIGFRAMVLADGTIMGSKDRYFNGDIGPDEFCSKRLVQLAHNVAAYCGGGTYNVQFEPVRPVMGLFVLHVGLLRVATAADEERQFSKLTAGLRTQQNDWLGIQRPGDETASSIYFDFNAKQGQFVYGGWPEGDTVRTGCEPGAIVWLNNRLGPREAFNMAHAMALADRLADEDHRFAYTLELDDGRIARFERQIKVVPNVSANARVVEGISFD